MLNYPFRVHFLVIFGVFFGKNVGISIHFFTGFTANGCTIQVHVHTDGGLRADARLCEVVIYRNVSDPHYGR